MLKKIAVAGGFGAVLLGSGTAALAASGSHHLAASASTSSTSSTVSTSSTASPTSTGAPAGGRHGRPDGRVGHDGRFGHGGFGGAGEVEHGQWVTRNAAGTDVTRDEVSGAVTAVSTSSISVKATDGFTATYVVSSSTKVFTGHNRTAGTISTVKVGDTVTVVGTGTSTLNATFIAEHPTGGSKPTTSASASPSAAPTS